MHKCTSLLAVVPVLLLTGACGGGHSAPTRAGATSLATPVSTRTTDDPALRRRRVEYAKLGTELLQDFQKAHIPLGEADRSKPDPDYCGIGLGGWFPEAGHSRARERVVALLRAAGWKDAITSGTDESHLTRDGWDLFITRTAGIKLDTDFTTDDGTKVDAGASYQTLNVTVNCDKTA